MDKTIKFLVDEFKPIEIYESESYITLIVENEKDISKKLKNLARKFEINKSLRILTNNELKIFPEDLGVKIY
ncbi:hypothetical protein SU69_09310 [Thermosipho melanesiensis]|uniref:Uncharacterized protein n=2 Tax=Thermosipho melanesiensis TaxID=46541 RepID=A6LP28_THEM4|nr:hypothetical protein [Thermosipho melanesiensis]ABR31679.1 hypothetical protein Tmel_1844 [Thermosipho melanesiensis BI429]APT74955.1 hypothetical protein BW47_09690 [Thermosipho melanesiensis]OOC35203.1 hypothetical protein SU69_09310 [Thermosipho melanesiensis]OOC35413.1 hypothetical protein SU70_09320 [Thermosipho melanesiensis]OOC36664.1 hypothetical protein SU68_09380 [Thermosipho melanesiensis]